MSKFASLFKNTFTKKRPSYESMARLELTRENLFVDCIFEASNQSPGKHKLMEWINKAERDPTFSEDFYLHAIRTNKEIFNLNHQTYGYVKTLVETDYLIGKCRNIVFSESKDNGDYLINLLVDVIYLLQEIDTSLRKGVPLHFKTVVEAVYLVKQILEEKLNIYFLGNAKSLQKEIQTAKQLRLEYQARTNQLNLKGEIEE